MSITEAQVRQVDELVQRMSDLCRAHISPMLQQALDEGAPPPVVASAVTNFSVFMIAAIACDLAPDDPARLGNAMLAGTAQGISRLHWSDYQAEKAHFDRAGRA